MSAGSPVPPVPQLLKAAPSIVETQTTEDILLTGVSTNFKQDVTTVSFGPDISVNSVAVVSSVLLIANITVGSTAATGERDVTVTTGTENVTLSGGFNVVSEGPGPARPPSPPIPWQYSVILKLDTIANSSGAEIWAISWDIDGKLCLMPDPADPNPIPARIPNFQPDNNFTVNVVQFILQGADGTPAVLTSSMTFTIPVGPPTLDIKSPSPVLTFPFLTPIPFETIEVKGQSTQVHMFGSILMTVLTMNALALPPIVAMTGNTSGGASPSPAAPDISALIQAAQQLKASAADPASISGAGFQTALASLMQQATATSGIPASQAGTADQTAATFQSVSLPWKVGSRAPVQKTYSFNQGGVQIELRVFVIAGTGLD